MKKEVLELLETIDRNQVERKAESSHAKNLHQLK